MARRQSGKRSLKRAYKKRRTHKRKAQLNRRKTQRGGFTLPETITSYVAKGKAMVEQGGEFINRFSAAGAIGILLKSMINIIQSLVNTIVSLMVMGIILMTIAKNPQDAARIVRDNLKEKFDKLKENNPSLQELIDRIKNRFEKQPVTVSDVSTSNVGKSVIYNVDKMRYQGLIVGEMPANEEYGEPMYYIWLKGGGLDELKKVRQNQPPTNPEFVFVPETDPTFIDAANNRYGQQQDTIESARQYYGLNDTVVQTSPEQEKSLLDRLLDQKDQFMKSDNKKQFVKNAIDGYILSKKLKLEKAINRFQDSDLKKDITELKDAILNKINGLKVDANTRIDQAKI